MVLSTIVFYFYRCVLGEDNKKLAESLLRHSLTLPVGLQLDESMAPEEFTMDESNLDISQTLRIEDLTMMFGHHMTCSDGNNRYSTKKPIKHFPQADIMSESECWSEPDRNVSLARVGLCDTGIAIMESASENNKFRSRRSRVSYGSRSEDNKNVNDTLLFEEISQLTKRNEQLGDEINDLRGKLESTMKLTNELTIERDELKNNLFSERSNLLEANKNIEAMNTTISVMESKIKDLEGQLIQSVQLVEKLRSERQELESTYLETERSLRRAADEATVQASQSALERARAQHDRLRVERELEEIREKLVSALEKNSQLEIEMTRKVGVEANIKMAVVHGGHPLEDDRPTSPDQGIDSDRLSSLEQNDAVSLSPRKFEISYYLNQLMSHILYATSNLRKVRSLLLMTSRIPICPML